MKKSIAILIALLLVLPAFSIIAPVRASDGAQLFAYYDGTNVFIAAYNVTIKAGETNITKADGIAHTGNFTMIFSVNGSLDVPVKFAGAGFDLYISKDYYSSLSPDDKVYATGFAKADVYTAGLKPYNVSNALLKNGWGMFYVGTVTNGSTTYGMLYGPIPFDITNDYKYIKVYDGNTNQVAVAGIIEILPSFSLSPTSGPGGHNVCLTGVALAPSTLYNISYGNTTTATAQVTTGTDGKFQYCWNIIDLCTDYDDDTFITVEIWIWNNATKTFIDMVTYDEYARTLLSLESPIWSSSGPWGNYSVTVDVNVLKDLEMEGNWFNPNAAVNVIIEGTTVATFNTNGTGYFDETITVPILALGLHNVTLANGGCNFIFTIDVHPTLIVTPDTGPIGTNVTFTIYGFPPGPVYLYWWVGGACDYETEYLWVANASAGPDGQFNVTLPTWIVPKMPGGPHEITAQSTYYNVSEGVDGTEIADTYFTVTPSLWVTPSTFDEDGTTFWVNGSGFDPMVAYVINVDNQAITVPSAGYFSNDYWAFWDYGTYYPWPIMQWVYNPGGQFVESDLCGDISIQLVKAGFGPGLHVVSLTASAFNDYWMYFDYGDSWYYYWEDAWEHITFGAPANDDWEGVFWNLGYYPTDVYATFTVTAVGNPIVDTILTNMTSQLTSINAKIVSIEGDVATLTTDVGQLQVSVAALDAKVVALQGSVATVQTTLGTMTGTLNTISGNTATILTDVGAIKADVSAMKPFLPVDMMPVWIAVIFAIIAAIASIYGVLVIRSKIAQ